MTTALIDIRPRTSWVRLRKIYENAMQPTSATQNPVNDSSAYRCNLRSRYQVVRPVAPKTDITSGNAGDRIAGGEGGIARFGE
jgi:hypothetical protein